MILIVIIVLITVTSPFIIYQVPTEMVDIVTFKLPEVLRDRKVLIFLIL